MKNLLTGLALIASGGLLAGCGEDLPGTDLLPDNPICEFECKGLAEASGGISGVQEVDAFFSAVGTLQVQAASLEADIRLELVNIAVALGVQGAAGMSISELNAAIKGQIDGGLGGKIEGGLTLQYSPPKCEVSASASVQAAAKCDASVMGGEAKVECKGSCEAEASAMVSCSGEAQLKCTGTAPSFECSGVCKGSCELEAGATCEGTCKGTCEVATEAECDGEFEASTGGGAGGGGTCKLNAGASCTGECKGSCELTAGGTCTGECKGECEYMAPEGGCTGGATAKCEAMGEAKVECSGKCDGEVTPPMVEANCEATAKAEASFAAECSPPKVDLKFALSAEFKAQLEGDVSAQAAFEGQIQAVGKAFGNLVAKGAKIEALLTSCADLGASGSAAVQGALSAAGEADLSLGAKLDLACGVAAFGSVPAAITAATGSLSASGKAVVDCTAALAGG
jgi:hypothetical protein